MSSMPTPVKSRGSTRSKAERKLAGTGEERYLSRAVSKALEILDILGREAGGQTMNGLAARLSLSKTSTFRLLRTLEATGHARLDGRGVYTLAPEKNAGAHGSWVDTLVEIATPHLRALSHELAETASLAAHYENRVEVVAVIESAQDVRMSNVVGHIVPPNASSLGKVIAAFQQVDAQEKLLRSFKIYRFTEQTITDRKSLLREYAQVREQGFAVDREECAVGGVCFSVPVLAADGRAPAAISVSLPKSRLGTVDQEVAIIAALRITATEIAAALHIL